MIYYPAKMEDFMDWIQVLTIIGSVAGAVIYVHNDSKAYMSQIQEDRRQQTERTDKLYEMFVELLKQKNTP
jgi:uncharacterized membrane protein